MVLANSSAFEQVGPLSMGEVRLAYIRYRSYATDVITPLYKSCDSIQVYVYVVNGSTHLGKLLPFSHDMHNLKFYDY